MIKIAGLGCKCHRIRFKTMGKLIDHYESMTILKIPTIKRDELKKDAEKIGVEFKVYLNNLFVYLFYIDYTKISRYVKRKIKKRMKK